MSDYTQSTAPLPGDVNIIDATIITSNGDGLDIIGMISEISLYEDIFSNTMSGYVVLVDAIDLLNEIPLLGEEMIKIELQTPGILDQTQRIKKIFYLYKMSESFAENKKQVYTLHFCSKELITSKNSKVYTSYSDIISETVKSIFSDKRYLAGTVGTTNADLLIENVEPTSNAYRFVAPYWSPFETINWLSAKALNKNITAKNSMGVPNYLFYENKNGYNFKSVDTLLAKPTKFDYVYGDVDANSGLGYDGDINEKYKYVIDVDTNLVYDYLKNVSAGMYASKLYTFDMTTRAINANGFDYFRDFDTSNHLNKAPLKNQNIIIRRLSSLHFIHKNNFLHGMYDLQPYKNVFLQRNSLLEQLTAKRLILTVHGKTDLTVGDTINFKMNKLRETTANNVEQLDSDYYSGKYLITAIRHQIQSGKHRMTVEIITDSFKSDSMIKIKDLKVKP